VPVGSCHLHLQWTARRCKERPPTPAPFRPQKHLPITALALRLLLDALRNRPGLEYRESPRELSRRSKRACSPHEPDPPIRVSSIYETAPVDCEPGAMPYLEAVMKINFTERARLDVQEAEKLPRIIDSDVHYAGNLVLNNPERDHHSAS